MYNAEKFLTMCIESALNQTCKDIEVIAVNDGSTDNSLQILQKYSDEIIIIDKKNGGTPTALNAGINVMKGEWFKWLSADDILKKNAVEVLLKESSEITDNEYCIFYSNYDLINNSGKIVKQFIEPNYNTLSLFDRNVILLDHFYGNGTTSLIHKSMFERYGLFDEKIGFQEDYEFWLRCSLLHGCRLHLIPQNLAQYRIHDGQLTHTKIDESLSHADDVRSFVLKKLPKDKKAEYEIALKKYSNKKPLRVKIRRGIRNMMFSLLPKETYDKIIQMYIERKRAKNFL